ncbi:MAG: Re/Si-specific NAD(P)(+) transhydrogenase subunit alpha [Candidatus Eisenbacteria bacterium]|nr:Re/Si-specific NAD(P)(+) transhydrogenase subunit alpha [Candidatus Eisenbacteria bacterium]
MRIAVPKEITPRETRVALVPETVARLVKAGQEVVVESGAGEAAGFTDDAYRQAGANLAPSAPSACEGANIVLKVHEPRQNAAIGRHEADLVPQGAVFVSFLGRDRNSEAVQKLAARKVTAFSMEMIPRTSRAQSMDALSSMAGVSGYKAALWGAGALGKFFPLKMTAAGTIAPANVFVLGCGVAGLEALATCRKLGAVVEAYDVRPAVKEEVESLGGRFVQIELAQKDVVAAGGYAKELSAEDQQRVKELLATHVAKSDVVITTAAIPGRKAPVLVTDAMVRGMRPGSVVVDIAAETGGNCEATVPGETVVKYGVTIMGPLNVPATLPFHASQMYSRNLHSLLKLMIDKEGRLRLDFEDDILRDACITRAAGEPAAAAGKAS